MNNFDFKYLSKKWWETQGPYKTLHFINNTRFNYIRNKAKINEKKILDIGCGGGILSEKLKTHGGIVTGIDISNELINIAKIHNKNNNIEYYNCDILELKTKQNKKYDIITCMEVLEHVKNQDSFIKTCKQKLKNKGSLFISSLNKNINTYIKIILLGEYVSNIIPKGTHLYEKFITPKSINLILKKYKLNIIEIKGIDYNPVTNQAKITNDIKNNYIMHIKNKNE